MAPVHTHSTPSYDADLAAVARLAEVDPGDIAGWAMFTWEAGGLVRLTHNACCSAHAREQLVWLLANMPAELVPCSAEQ